MIDFIIILSQFILYFCEDIELSWHGSLEVIPDTFVYYDISSYDPGDKITFKITIDYSDTADLIMKNCYNFKIDQVPTKDPHDSYYKENLRNVSNKNVTYSGRNGYTSTFTWDEIKQSENNYIFIILPTPFPDYYRTWERKIKIEVAGLSIVAIIGIIIGSFSFIALIIAAIFYCPKGTGNSILDKSVHDIDPTLNDRKIKFINQLGFFPDEPGLYSHKNNHSSAESKYPSPST